MDCRPLSSSNQNFQISPLLKKCYQENTQGLVVNKQEIQDSSYQDHFSKIREAICEATEKIATLEQKKIACILGAGAAHDIPLNILADRFDKIYLVDINTEFTKKAVEEQVPENLRKKFRIKEADCTGILEELCIKAEKIAEETSDPKEFAKKVLQLIPTLTPIENKYQKKGGYSFVCSALIASQLGRDLFNYLDAFSLDKYNQSFEKSCMDGWFTFKNAVAIEKILTQIGEKYLENLSQLTKRNGIIYFADHLSYNSIIRHETEDGMKEGITKQEIEWHPKFQEFISQFDQIIPLKQWEWQLPFTEQEGDVSESKSFQISSYVLKNRCLENLEVQLVSEKENRLSLIGNKT